MTEPVEPVIEPVIEPVVTIDPVVDPVIEPIVADKPQTVPLKVMLDRLSEVQRKREESDNRATAAERRATDAEALAARLQSGNNTLPVQRTSPTEQNVDMALVQQEAARLRMGETRQQIIRDGYATFGGAKFDEDARILSAVGCVGDDFIADVVAVDRANAHKTLATLAAEPETAAHLAGLDSRSRIAELTRMTMAKAEPKIDNPIVPIVPKVAPKAVSKAPAPAPVVDPSASKIVDWRADEASDEDFTKGFNETMAKRAARR